jgi:hypothetical protein
VDLFDICHELELQLGHDGGPCIMPEKVPRVLIAVDSSGMRKIRVRYCGCQPIERWQQLMRARLYPSSDIKPRSCFTFSFLDSFIKVSLQGKIPLYDFYLSVLHKSHNTATSDKLVSTSSGFTLHSKPSSLAFALEPTLNCVPAIHPAEDDETSGPRSRSGGIRSNAAGGIGVGLPCVSAAWKKYVTGAHQIYHAEQEVRCRSALLMSSSNIAL